MGGANAADGANVKAGKTLKSMFSHTTTLNRSVRAPTDTYKNTSDLWYLHTFRKYLAAIKDGFISACSAEIKMKSAYGIWMLFLYAFV